MGMSIESSNSAAQHRLSAIIAKFVGSPHARSFCEQRGLPMRAGYALTQPPTLLSVCGSAKRARICCAGNAIAPNWAESDYFALSNAIVHDALVLHAPICGFSRGNGESSLNRGVFALCLQFEYLQCNARRWRSVPKARPSSIRVRGGLPYAGKPRADHFPTLL